MERVYIPMRDLRGYISPNKIARVIRAGGTERDRLLMEVLWTTGARISEIVNWEWGICPEDLIPKENVVIIRTLKRRKKDPPVPPPERRVPIPAWLMKKLLAFCANTPAQHRIFSMSRQWAFEIVRRAGKDSGVLKIGRKKIHPHHFRHSHCVAYIKANNTLEGLRKLQQRLQHASITTTAHYLQFALEGEQRRIEDIFKPI